MSKSLNHSFVRTKTLFEVVFMTLMLSMALLPNDSSAEVYKCKNAKGKITYSDSPCQKHTAALQVDNSIQFENSAAGRQTAATNRSVAEMRAAEANERKYRQRVVEEQMKLRPPRKIIVPVQGAPKPTVLTHCAPGFCYDNQGGVYHQNGPDFMTGPDGRVCHRAGNMWNCN